MNTMALASFSLALTLVGASGARISAQCSTQWLPGPAFVGTSGQTNGQVIATTMWDPDGIGPMQPVLVVGGAFSHSGGAPANNIAAYNPVSGASSALGSGMSGGPLSPSVRALAVLPNGDLVAGGVFTTAGGVSANYVARWNGTSWSALGTGMSGPVHALMTMPNGDLVAGGSFATAGGVSANYIARWNGTSWSALGSGMTVTGPFPLVLPVVGALALLPNGDLVAGGHFTSAGGAVRIARWDGTSWSALGSGMDSDVMALCRRRTRRPHPRGAATAGWHHDRQTTLPNGDLVAGGTFTSAGGVNTAGIARWNGTSWSALGSGINGGPVSALRTLPNGDLVAGGHFVSAGGVSASHIARWNGTSWSALGSGITTVNGGVSTLTPLPNGDLVAGGLFTSAGGVSASHIARWNGTSWQGTSWSPQGLPPNGFVYALTALPNGHLVAGGTFTLAGSVSASNIARWDGTSWSALGSGMNDGVGALTTLPNGDLVAGGQFASAGGVLASNIARWNGTSWSALGTGTNGTVYALATLPNGDLVAAGLFTAAGGVSANHVARWDGTNWSALGTGISGGVVSALTTLPNGDLVAGGSFGVAGGVSAANIARWDGTNWSALGTGVNDWVHALTMLPDGGLVAGGRFTVAGAVSASRIARWDGTNWSSLGSGVNDKIYSLTALPNGDVVAGGWFSSAGGVSASWIARSNGTSWSALGSGVNGAVHALTTLTNGDLVAGGVLSRIPQLTTTCPATAVSYGAGCAGSGGLNVLAATTMPWIGATFRAKATGMPPLALVLSIYGFTSLSIPFASVLPQGLPGCDILMTSDIADVLLPSAGIVQTQVALPNVPAIVGQTFHHYVVPFEIDLAMSITAITSSNALTCSVGAF